MRMLPVLSFVATIAMSIAAPALADTAETQSFEHEGTRYVYKVVEKGNAQKITGHYYPGAVPFSLIVQNGTVSGVSNGGRVRFKVSAAQGAIKASDSRLTMR
mgnify:CR=1 FL=1